MSAEKIWERIIIFVFCLCFFFVTWTTKSRNGWGQKESLEVSRSNPTAQTGTSRASCPESSQMALSISKDGDPTISLGRLCQSSVALTVKKSFPMFRGSLLCFSLCPLPLVLTLGVSEKVLYALSLHIYRCWWGLVLFRLSNPISLSLFS